MLTMVEKNVSNKIRKETKLNLSGTESKSEVLMNQQDERTDCIAQEGRNTGRKYKF